MVGWSNLIARLPHTSQLNTALRATLTTSHLLRKLWATLSWSTWLDISYIGRHEPVSRETEVCKFNDQSLGELQHFLQWCFRLWKWALAKWSIMGIVMRLWSSCRWWGRSFKYFPTVISLWGRGWSCGQWMLDSTVRWQLWRHGLINVWSLKWNVHLWLFSPCWSTLLRIDSNVCLVALEITQDADTALECDYNRNI